MALFAASSKFCARLLENGLLPTHKVLSPHKSLQIERIIH